MEKQINAVSWNVEELEIVRKDLVELRALLDVVACSLCCLDGERAEIKVLEHCGELLDVSSSYLPDAPEVDQVALQREIRWSTLNPQERACLAAAGLSETE